MKCPRCHDAELAPCKACGGDVTVEYCRHCQGVWFEAGEMEQVLDVAAKDLEKRSGYRSVPCPNCGEAMKAFTYPQTLAEVDMCGRCNGIWLDGGEFKEIKTVRENLLRRNRLEGYSAVHGVKGALIKFIESAIDRLRTVWR